MSHLKIVMLNSGTSLWVEPANSSLNADLTCTFGITRRADVYWKVSLLFKFVHIFLQMNEEQQ